MIGMIGSNYLEKYFDEVSFGYCSKKRFWRMKYAFEAVLEYVDYFWKNDLVGKFNLFLYWTALEKQRRGNQEFS